LARELNEAAAGMVADHKGRYGFFAVLPIPDIDACLREIEYGNALKILPKPRAI
jgi:hypothetical protein